MIEEGLEEEVKNLEALGEISEYENGGLSSGGTILTEFIIEIKSYQKLKKIHVAMPSDKLLGSSAMGKILYCLPIRHLKNS